MSEMKPKKRVNRGFIVSMVLLGAVVLYVIATQFMLIPQRNELKRPPTPSGRPSRASPP